MTVIYHNLKVVIVIIKVFTYAKLAVKHKHLRCMHGGAAKHMFSEPKLT